ncbi:Ig-like domain-containing protein [Alkalihalobacterium elongatum]|uniref:Ig-like domain-containing protein n=1 Tax=Alkalihalobacterium elongatum TaxID=2675466 RepID=UPI001C1F52B3|nr:Ig-like domain-containing protein [Alkalihalobacterium elongatum]
MVATIVDGYKKNKFLVTIPVLALLIVSFILFNNKAFSVDGMFVEYVNGNQGTADSWNMEKEAFQKEWFTDETPPSFILNLNTKIDTDVDRPFTVEAKFGKTEYADADLAINKVDQAGNYRVTIPAPADGSNGQYNITIAIEENELGLPPGAHRFTITRDATSPEVEIKGVEDEAYTEGDVAIGITVKEQHVYEKYVSVTRNGVEYRDLPSFQAKGNDTYLLNYKFTKSGQYEVNVIVKDKAGNETVQNKVFTISKGEPEVASPDNKAIFAPKEVEVTVTSEVPLASATIEALKDGKAFTLKDKQAFTLSNDKLTATWKHEFTEDGDYELTVTATEAHKNGNTYEALGPIAFTVDGTVPKLTIAGLDPNDNGDTIYNFAQQVGLTVIDKNIRANKIDVTVTKDGQPYELNGLKWTATEDGQGLTADYEFKAEGIYQLTFNATDEAGNRANEETKANFTIDKTAPKLTIDSNGTALRNTYNAEEAKNGVPVKIKIEDATLDLAKTQVSITKNGKDYLNVSKDSSPSLHLNEMKSVATFEYTFEENGSYEIAVEATDYFEKESKKSAAFTLDRDPPTLSVTYVDGDEEKDINNKDQFKQDKVVRFTVSDNNIDEDTIELTVLKQDLQDSEASLYLTLDSEQLTKTVTENAIVYEYPFADDGVYEVQFSAADSVGNHQGKGRGNGRNKQETVELEPFIFTIDTEKPAIKVSGLDTLAGHKYYAEAKNVTISIEDLTLDEEQTAIKVTKDGEAYISINVPEEDDTDAFTRKRTNHLSGDNMIAELKQSFKTDGTYVIYAGATDQLGHSNPEDGAALQELVQFTIDQTVPDIKLIGVDHNGDRIDDSDESKPSMYIQKGVVTVLVDELHLKEKSVTINGKSFTEHFPDVDWNQVSETSYELTLDFNREDFTDRKYTVAVNVTDKAENQVSERLTFYLDNTKPVITLTTEGHIVDDKKPVMFNQNGKLTVKVEEENYRTNQVDITVKKKGDRSFEDNRFNNQWKNSSKDSTLTLPVNRASGYEDGEYTITVKATDAAENEAVSQSLTFIIDTTRPEIKLTGKDQDGETYRGGSVNETRPTNMFIRNGELTVEVDEQNFSTNNVTFRVTKKGDSSFRDPRFREQWENDGKKSSLTLPIDSRSGYADGEYTITINATDRAGNEAVGQTLTFIVDNVAPNITITGEDHDGKKYTGVDRNGRDHQSTPSMYIQNGKLTVAVEEENFSMNDVSITVRKRGDDSFRDSRFNNQWENSGKRSTLTLPITTGETGQYSDGVYTIRVVSEDKTGNKSSKILTFVVDTKAPNLVIEGLEDDKHYNNNRVTATFKARDTNLNETNTRLTIRHVNAGTTEVVRMADLTNGRYTFTKEETYAIKWESTDRAGNYAKEELTFVIDRTAPVLKIAGVENNSFNPTAKRVTVSVDEFYFETNTVDLQVMKNNQPYSMGTWRNTGKVSSLSHNFTEDGFYTIALTATDKAGNGPITERIEFTIDTVNPEIEISGVDNGEYYNVDKPVNVTIRDVNLDVNTIRVTRDGNNYPVGGFAITEAAKGSGNQSVARFNHNFSQEGVYEIFVEAIDKAGNMSTQTVQFTIDKTAPVITPKFRGEGRVIEDGEYINRVFTPEFALDESEDTIVSVTLNDGPNIAGNIPVASKDMVYHYKVLATDKAGNETTLSISFTLDTTMPELDITGIVDGYFNENITPMVTYSDLNLDESRTSVTLNNEPYASGTKLEYEQDYVLKAVITDLADNVTSRTIVFTIDKTAPIIRFLEPINNRYFNFSLIPDFIIESLSPYDIIAITLNGNPYTIGDPIEEEGKHVLFFEVKDRAGNIQTLSIEFIIDLTAPNVIYNGVTDNGRYYETVALDILLDNPNDKFREISINGEAFKGDVVEENGYQIIRTTLDEKKTYEVSVEAYDEAGNETQSQITFEIAEKHILIKFYENKPLFAAALISLLGGATGGTILIRRRKKKIVEEELIEAGEIPSREE